MGQDLVLLAGCASFYIIGDPFLHLGPPVFFLRPPDGLVTAWVSRCGMVMHEGHNAPFDLEDGGYDDFPFRRNDGGRCNCKLVFG